MSRLTRFTKEASKGSHLNIKMCSLVEDSILAQHGLEKLIPLLDHYCGIYDGACKPKGCPIWDVPKEIECLD